MNQEQRESLDIDVLFVGGGPAGLAGAYHLAKLIERHNSAASENPGNQPGRRIEVSIAVLEKGKEIGSHAISGAVVDPTAFRGLYDDWRSAPFEAPVGTERLLWMTSKRALSMPIPPPLENHGKYVASLGKLVKWMAAKCEDAGVDIFCEFPAADVLTDTPSGRVVGVRTGDRGIGHDGARKANYEPGVDIMTRALVLAEGPRGTLAKQLEQRDGLTKGKNPQVYALGIKEVWELPEGRIEPGEVTHTMGWPLDLHTYGGGFLYGMKNDLLIAGLVVGLDYRNPRLDPHQEFQRFKTHPAMRKLLEGGRMAYYGAKAIPEGGWFSMPRPWGDGYLITGDSIGMLNSMRLKGIHLAMKSGMLAAETVFEGLLADNLGVDSLARFEDKIENSWIKQELWEVRNFHQAFDYGALAGMFQAGIGMLTNGAGFGLFNRLTSHPGHQRMRQLGASETHEKPAAVEFAVEFDGVLTFDKLADVYNSGTAHEEDQPSHLHVVDTDICINQCAREFGNPCEAFCPAQVYEMVADPESPTGRRLQINASNCVHCKTCDIMDPYQIIDWVTPEGGGGPNYGKNVVRSPSSIGSLLTLAVLLALGCVGQIPSENDRTPLDFDLLFGDNVAGNRPTALEWSPDGNRLGFFYDDGSGKGLWVWDHASGETNLQLRQGTHDLDKLEKFHWSPDGRSILLESGGDLVLSSLGSEGVRKLTATEAAEEDPRFSPQGDRIAFVRDSDLWSYDIHSSLETRLTRDGQDGVTLNGKTDWVYWEEIWGRRQTGHWWSPDGSRIAYYRFDDTSVREYPLADFTQQYPNIAQQRYPKAGESNPRVQVGVLELSTGATRWLISNTEDDAYLARVEWLPDGNAIAVQRLSRDQNHLEVLLCSSDGGAECGLLLEEKSKTWVNLTDDLRFLPDGRFLWTTEKSGWSELWLYDVDGAPIRRLTPDGWTIAQVDEVVPSVDSVVWTGYKTAGLGALHRTTFSQSLAGGAPSMLSSAGTTAGATVAKASGLTAIVESRSDVPHSAFVADLSGQRQQDLPVRGPSGYDPVELPQWQFLTVPGPDGLELPAALLEPTGIDPAAKYPVIQYHYGGPASQVVTDAWGTRGRNLWHKSMAKRGYGVLMVDNAGIDYFGKTGADRLHRRFGEVNLAAQTAGVEFLEDSGWADPDRIGLWGWSGGGSNTLYSILNSPGTWRAAVSGAPVTNWRFYDTIWTERYLDHPQDNAEGYEQSSAVTHAGKLEAALLLVHGTADDNVHPQNTFVMAAELIAAGKPFDLAIHPRQKHGFRGGDSRHFYERMTRFFDRELSE